MREVMRDVCNRHPPTQRIAIALVTVAWLIVIGHAATVKSTARSGVMSPSVSSSVSSSFPVYAGGGGGYVRPDGLQIDANAPGLVLLSTFGVLCGSVRLLPDSATIRTTPLSASALNEVTSAQLGRIASQMCLETFGNGFSVFTTGTAKTTVNATSASGRSLFVLACPNALSSQEGSGGVSMSACVAYPANTTQTSLTCRSLLTVRCQAPASFYIPDGAYQPTRVWLPLQWRNATLDGSHVEPSNVWGQAVCVQLAAMRAGLVVDDGRGTRSAAALPTTLASPLRVTASLTTGEGTAVVNPPASQDVQFDVSCPSMTTASFPLSTVVQTGSSSSSSSNAWSNLTVGCVIIPRASPVNTSTVAVVGCEDLDRLPPPFLDSSVTGNSSASNSSPMSSIPSLYGAALQRGNCSVLLDVSQSTGIALSCAVSNGGSVSLPLCFRHAFQLSQLSQPLCRVVGGFDTGAVAPTAVAISSVLGGSFAVGIECPVSSMSTFPLYTARSSLHSCRLLLASDASSNSSGLLQLNVMQASTMLPVSDEWLGSLATTCPVIQCSNVAAPQPRVSWIVGAVLFAAVLVMSGILAVYRSVQGRSQSLRDSASAASGAKRRQRFRIRNQSVKSSTSTRSSGRGTSSPTLGDEGAKPVAVIT